MFILCLITYMSSVLLSHNCLDAKTFGRISCNQSGNRPSNPRSIDSRLHRDAPCCPWVGTHFHSTSDHLDETRVKQWRSVKQPQKGLVVPCILHQLHHFLWTNAHDEFNVVQNAASGPLRSGDAVIQHPDHAVSARHVQWEQHGWWGQMGLAKIGQQLVV